jgi:Cu/Ag efflux pump CusA
VHIEGLVDEPMIQVTVDIVKAAPHGIKPGDVRRATAAVFAGIEVGSLFEEQKVFEVVVWGSEKARNSVSSLKEVLVDKPNGGYVRLGDIADVEIISGPTSIAHEAISPLIDVSANVQGRKASAVFQDVKTKMQDIQFPLEYHLEVIGGYVERERTTYMILGIGLTVIMVIYFLLQAAFGSFLLSLFALIAFIGALVGGVFSLLITGFTITLGALLGFLSIFGIAVRNGVVLIRHYRYLQEQEGVPFGRDLVLKGTSERASPILTTAIAIAAALLPIIILGDISGLEILYPMACVILGGLVTSTAINLVVIPHLYLVFGKKESTLDTLDN